ncbi:hypothetical protein TWF718_000473 [Orbilia javanica]|uniref:Rhamnogalacturonase A/B/Epimerase-like pectate lyase domain-containing protein n=1 Tax=Orbilia javanica TaxID=47235 RepID=A0AAN8RM72_9PEZI
MSPIFIFFSFLIGLSSITKVVDAGAIPIDGPSPQLLEPRAAPDNFWLTSMAHGSSPYAPAGYPVFRNVKDYGAKGDGVTDDTDAINAAASAGGRCEGDCGSSSVLGALVYFPSGTYIISKPIFQHYYTQFVGNPNDRPILKATAGFKGIALIDSDFYVPRGNGTQWYINQSNFFRQIRNLILDITAMPGVIRDGQSEWSPTALHWQVAQATSLYNIHFIMSTAPGNNQTGIFMENGSGGFISDLTFFGGQYGMRCGAQQFTARDLHFTSQITAIQMIWDWTWTWKNIYIYSCWVGIDVTGDGSANGQPIASITVLDSFFASVPIAILTSGQTNIQIDNTEIIDCNIVVGKPGGPTILAGGNRIIQSWVTGRVYDSYDSTGSSFTGVPKYIPPKSAGLLDPSGKFFVRSKPQYEGLAAGSFYNVKSAGAQGDGQNDDTAAINNALRSAGGRIVFFPAGIYLVTGEIFVPVGSKIVGQSWSQIMGTGAYFNDINNPKVMVKVGNPGESGIIEIQDLIFTTRGATVGAILMEWNVKQSTQGSAAMWDSHFRIGGAAGTDLQATNCPKLTGFVNPDCIAASLMLHITPQASAYLENVWAWVADHDVDIPAQTQIDIFVARGVLIESTTPTWLWGTASEHSVLYQYQTYKASDLFMGLIQTESPYFQSQPMAPAPFVSLDITPDLFPSDPEFMSCNIAPSKKLCSVSWALRVIQSTKVYIYGVGFYSWFQDYYSQACVAKESCQQSLIDTSYSENIFMYGIATKGAQEVISPQGDTFIPVLQADNQNGYTTSVTAWIPLAEPGSVNFGRAPRAIVRYDPDEARNLPRFQYWAAFGDSYSAGPGAGRYVPIKAYKSRSIPYPRKECSIYDASYPFLLGNGRSPASRLNNLDGPNWAMWSCTGARALEPDSSEGDPVIMEEQMEYLRGDEDFITLSIGGNDMGFGALGNACVFAILPTSRADCIAKMTKASAFVQRGGGLQDLLEQVYMGIIYRYYERKHANAKKHFTIFVTPYLGLFKFNSDPNYQTSCNTNNFKYRSTESGWFDLNKDYEPSPLDFDNRFYWYTLTVRLNEAINRAANRVNRWGGQYESRVIVVQHADTIFEGHRFCEADADPEPNYDRINAGDTWFYLPTIIRLNAKRSLEAGNATDLNATIFARQTEYGLDIDAPDTIDEGAMIELTDDYFGQRGTMKALIAGLSDADPRRNWFERLAWLGIGMIRSAHPTVPGFRAIKVSVCQAICTRFRNVPGCRPTDDFLEWCPF